MTTAVALPPTYEAALQEMERRGAAACVKIEEARKAVVSDEIEVDVDTPSVTIHLIELERATRRAREATRPPPTRLPTEPATARRQR